MIPSHRPKRLSANLAAGCSHSKESFNSPLRLSATPRSHRQSIPLLFGSPVTEKKRLLGKNSVCQRYLHQPLDPGSHSFQLPVLSQHLPNRQDEAHRVCYERMVMVCYIALLFWKPLWFTVLTSDSCDAASSSRYLPSSSSQSSDHYTRFDSFPPRRDNDFAASFILSWI